MSQICFPLDPDCAGVKKLRENMATYVTLKYHLSEQVGVQISKEVAAHRKDCVRCEDYSREFFHTQ